MANERLKIRPRISNVRDIILMQISEKNGYTAHDNFIPGLLSLYLLISHKTQEAWQKN